MGWWGKVGKEKKKGKQPAAAKGIQQHMEGKPTHTAQATKGKNEGTKYVFYKKVNVNVIIL